ncbi:MAG: MmgE/PrpD family protein [Erythrobacter sp.]
MQTERSATVSREIGPTTGKLVERIMASHAGQFPSEARQCAHKFLIDSMLVGIAGTSNPAADNILAVAQKWDQGQPGNCRVLGRSDVKLSPHSAAVINGFQIHCLEWDGLHEPSVVIALCVTSAALISECQEQDRDIDEVLKAFAVGVEVAVFFGAGSQSQPKFFRPSTAGLMGAAIAIGLLRGFDAAQLTDLLGMAYSQASGTMQAHWEGSETLPLQIGIAARAALSAADLVAGGTGAPHDVVDGKFGYFKLIEEGGSLDPHFDAWCKPWKITEVAHKPFPAGRATQASLTALMDFAAQHSFSMDDINRFEASVPPLILLLVGRPWKLGMSPAYARLCLEFVVPQMIRNGRIDPRNFIDDVFNADQAKNDAQRISVQLNENRDPNALGPQDISIELKDGRTFSCEVDAPFGSPDRPMTREDQINKANFCFEIAGIPAQAEALFEIGSEPGGGAQFGALLDMLCPQSQPSERNSFR